MNYVYILWVFFLCFTADFLIKYVEAALIPERIIGGELVRPGKYKYVVSLQLEKEHICGGGILSNFFVLTAAHCIIDNNNEFVTHDGAWYIVAGTMNASEIEPPAVRVKVAKMFALKEFIPENPNPGLPFRSSADIAVLRLHRGLDIRNNELLGQLELPRLGDPYLSYTNAELFLAGYGYDTITFDYDKISNQIENIVGSSGKALKYAVSHVLDNSECANTFSTPIAPSHLCAQMIQRNMRVGEGICLGDSGGPLVDNDNFVVAVASMGLKFCDERIFPTIYTRVSHFLPFIRNAMRGIDGPEMRSVLL